MRSILFLAKYTEDLKLSVLFWTPFVYLFKAQRTNFRFVDTNN